MNVFIVGVTGGVGRRVASRLATEGHTVAAIVRRAEEASELSEQGIKAHLGDVVSDSVDTLAELMSGSDAALFTAGAGGSGAEATSAVDGDGPGKVAQAAEAAGVRRFYLVSVFPEALRERDPDDGFEHYMLEKKKAETQLVLTDLDWVILRPSVLTDDLGSGRVNLGLAQIHGEIPRDDVADALVALLATPNLSRVILEVTGGITPTNEAVAALANQR